MNSPEKKMIYGVRKWTLKQNRRELLGNSIDVESVPVPIENVNVVELYSINRVETELEGNKHVVL